VFPNYFRRKQFAIRQRLTLTCGADLKPKRGKGTIRRTDMHRHGNRVTRSCAAKSAQAVKITTSLTRSRGFESGVEKDTVCRPRTCDFSWITRKFWRGDCFTNSQRTTTRRVANRQPIGIPTCMSPRHIPLRTGSQNCRFLSFMGWLGRAMAEPFVDVGKTDSTLSDANRVSPAVPGSKYGSANPTLQWQISGRPDCTPPSGPGFHVPCPSGVPFSSRRPTT
jgi:hypothetical protein